MAFAFNRCILFIRDSNIQKSRFWTRNTEQQAKQQNDDERLRDLLQKSRRFGVDTLLVAKL